MAVKLIPVKCPECGATLNIEENRTQAFCSYCGAKVLIHNDNEFTYRHIDVADLERAETERTVKLKEMELVEKSQHNQEKTKKIVGIAALSMLVFGVFMVAFGHIFGGSDSTRFTLPGLYSILGGMIVGLFFMPRGNEDAIDKIDGKIKIPNSIGAYTEKSYTAIAAILESAGFTNIKCVALNDLVVGILDRPGIVDSITINGETIRIGMRYPKDAAIVISYHSRG